MRSHTPEPAILTRLQHMLAGIYDVPCDVDVADFLFTERAGLPEHLRATPSDEQVLVATRGDEAAIGVFLDAAVLERLRQSDPMDALNAGNLADLLTVLEGVSHFMYLAWNAGHDRPVSLLELELQGEVDKYVGTLALLRAQDPARFPVELHWLLFQRTRVDGALAGERADLYRRAHRFAERYCGGLQRQLGAHRASAAGEVSSELRRFYRFSSARKFRHIEHMA